MSLFDSFKENQPILEDDFWRSHKEFIIKKFSENAYSFCGISIDVACRFLLEQKYICYSFYEEYNHITFWSKNSQPATPNINANQTESIHTLINPNLEFIEYKCSDELKKDFNKFYIGQIDFNHFAETHNLDFLVIGHDNFIISIYFKNESQEQKIIETALAVQSFYRNFEVDLTRNAGLLNHILNANIKEEIKLRTKKDKTFITYLTPSKYFIKRILHLKDKIALEII